MFGITRLTPQEKALHDKKKEIKELEDKLVKETRIRAESLKRSEALSKSLEKALAEEKTL